MNIGGSIRINKCGMLLVVIVVMIVVYKYKFTGEPPYPDKDSFSNVINLRKLLIGSIQAAYMGGIEVIKISKEPNFNVKSKGKTHEGANDPVTDADIKSHCVMQRGLLHIFPSLNVVSEEDISHFDCPNTKLFDLDPTVLLETSIIPDKQVAAKDITVWIDPLDATQEYSEKLFQYVTTMVCVAYKGKPIIGVINRPFLQKTTWAWDPIAFSEDLQHIKRDDVPAKNIVITVSRSHAGNVKNVSKTLFGNEAHILTAAGAGYKVLQVVFNNATAYLHTTAIKKWDICAGNAILNALGGKMTNLLDEEIDYKQGDALNEKGLLATMKNHQFYIEKFKDLPLA